MKEFFETIRRQLSEFWGKLDKGKKIQLFVGLGLIIALSIIFAVVLGRVEYSVLYSELNPKDAGVVMETLKAMQVDAKTQGTGTILVPKEQADELRIQLAAEGYPPSGLNYDIFGMGSGFGMTDLEKEAYYQYQLMEHLRVTISTMDKIKDANVLIIMPTESPFAMTPNEREASATVTLLLEDGAQISSSQVATIGQLVLKSVPRLKMENIRVLDTQMNLYDISGDDSSEELAGNRQQLREQVRDDLVQQIVRLLEPVFGPGRVKAAVNVDLNFDTEKVSSITFEPPVEGEDNGMIASIKELNEAVRQGEAAAGVPGTDTNGMGVQYPYDGLQDDEVYEKASREINYEMNETRSELERAQGGIKDLSVAVLIDSQVFAEDFTDRVQNLVAMSVGVDEQLISVERLPFNNITDQTTQTFIESMTSIRNAELVRTIIIMGTILLIVILALIFLRALFRRREIAVTPEGMDILLPGEDYEEGGEEGMFQNEQGELLSPESILEREKSNSVFQIESFIEKDPEAVAQLLRNWLSDDFN